MDDTPLVTRYCRCIYASLTPDTASSILLPENLQGWIPGPWLTANWVGFPRTKLRGLARPHLMDDTHQKETYKFMDVPQLLFPKGT